MNFNLVKINPNPDKERYHLVNLILKLTLDEIKTCKILDQVGWPDQGWRGI